MKRKINLNKLKQMQKLKLMTLKNGSGSSNRANIYENELPKLNFD